MDYGFTYTLFEQFGDYPALGITAPIVRQPYSTL
jgi:hypothetical protein